MQHTFYFLKSLILTINNFKFCCCCFNNLLDDYSIKQTKNQLKHFRLCFFFSKKSIFITYIENEYWQKSKQVRIYKEIGLKFTKQYT